MLNRIGWLLITLIGAVMIILTFGLQLPHRLDDAQKVLDGADDIFADERLDPLPGAVVVIDRIVGGLDAVISGDPARQAEIPALVTFLNQATGLPPDKILAALQGVAPHTTGLIVAQPVVDANGEIPGIVALLSQVLNLPPDQIVAALGANFPILANALTDALPAITDNWDNLQPGWTRFDGTTQVKTVPDVVKYLREDVVPRLVENKDNFHHADELPPAVRFFPWFFIGIGTILILLGGPMFLMGGMGGGRSS